MATCDYGAAMRSKMFHHQNIVHRRIFVHCNGELSSKIDFVEERSQGQNKHACIGEMMGHHRIIDLSQNGLLMEWQVVIAPPLCGNADSPWLPRFHLHAE